MLKLLLHFLCALRTILWQILDHLEDQSIEIRGYLSIIGKNWRELEALISIIRLLTSETVVHGCAEAVHISASIRLCEADFWCNIAFCAECLGIACLSCFEVSCNAEIN